MADGDKIVTLDGLKAVHDYDTAQITDLKNSLSRTNYTVTSGAYVNKNYGTFIENTTGNPKVVSGIPVIGGAVITLEMPSVLYGSPRGTAFFDADNRFIAPVTVDETVIGGIAYEARTTSYTMIAPSNAAFLAITVFGDNGYKLTGVQEVEDVIRRINSLGTYTNGIRLTSLDKQTGAFVNGTNGKTAEQASYDVYAMRVFPKTVVNLTIPDFTHASVGYALYNAKGTYISGGAYSGAKGTTYTITVPDNAVTLKFSAYNLASALPVLDVLTGADEIYNAVKGIELQIDDSDPLARINDTPTFIRMFRKIACIGDSLTAGALNETTPDPTSTYANPEFGYPSNLAKLTGVEVYNLGAGGARAAHTTPGSTDGRSWWEFMEEGERFPKNNFKSNPCDAYIIALGTNDVPRDAGFDGTVNAAGVAEEQAETSVGGYAQIIRRIKVYQPKAKIFLVTIPTWRNAADAQKRDEANEKIRALAGYFSNCYTIDLAAYDIDNFRMYYINGSHNNALGYNLRARQYAAYIDWIIRHNLNDFRNVGFIGTDKDYQPST